MADSTNNRSLLSRLHYDMAIAEADEHRVKMEREVGLIRAQLQQIQDNQESARRRIQQNQSDFSRVLGLLKEYRATIEEMEKRNRKLRWKYFDAVREREVLKSTVRQLRGQVDNYSFMAALPSRVPKEHQEDPSFTDPENLIDLEPMD